MTTGSLPSLGPVPSYVDKPGTSAAVGCTLTQVNGDCSNPRGHDPTKRTRTRIWLVVGASGNLL